MTRLNVYSGEFYVVIVVQLKVMANMHRIEVVLVTKMAMHMPVRIVESTITYHRKIYKEVL